MNELNRIIENIMERNGYDKNSEHDRKRLLTDLMFDIKDISVTEEELSIMKKAVKEIVSR